MYQTEYFTCSCYSPEHTLRFILDLEDGELWSEVYLTHKNFWRRLGTALKYLVGKDTETWNDWIVIPQDYDRLVNLLTEARRIYTEKDTAKYLQQLTKEKSDAFCAR